MYVYVYLYIYIYIERERETYTHDNNDIYREFPVLLRGVPRSRSRSGNQDSQLEVLKPWHRFMHICIYIYNTYR